MNKLINTFKYGSWKTRLFFGTIALAFLGGAATIAVAAIAGLGIIPIAVGGAAMVLGLGMSTMVTVVSDDENKNGEQTGPGSGEVGEDGENEEKTAPENGNSTGSQEKAEGGDTAGSAEKAEGLEKAGNAEKAESGETVRSAEIAEG